VTLPQNHVQRFRVLDLDGFELDRNVSHGIPPNGNWLLDAGCRMLGVAADGKDAG
jgi:hypothetical protein